MINPIAVLLKQYPRHQRRLGRQLGRGLRRGYLI